MLYKVVEAVIASGDTESAIADLANYAIAGLLIPTVDSGNLTFKVCDTPGGTFQLLESASAAAIAVTAGTGNFALGADDLTDLAPYRFVKIVSAVTQTAARTFKWVLKG